MKSYSPQRIKKQRGAVLFIMIMVLLALTIITLMTTNIGKSDVRISHAYSEKAKSFINAEELLARLQYILEQVPIPEGIAAKGGSININNIIWRTDDLIEAQTIITKQGEPDFTDPTFAEGWQDAKKGEMIGSALTCSNIRAWIEKLKTLGSKANILDCGKIDPDNKARTIIELVSQKKNEGDIDELRDVYYYRITIYAEGDHLGRSLVQGVAGVQYN